MRFFPLCTFVSFVVDEVQMLEPQRTRRYTKEVMALYTRAAPSWNSYLIRVPQRQVTANPPDPRARVEFAV